jgi:hypothetical protein
MRSEKAALALYALVAGAALAVGFVLGRPDLYHHPLPLLGLPPWLEPLVGVVVGLLLGLAVVRLTQRAVTPWRWGPAVRLHQGLRELLGVADQPLCEADVLALAGSSAIAEELLFRGLLVPAIGLLASSLVFGLLHYAPRRRGMLAWIPMAVLMGLALGGLFVAVGGLSAPIAAHFVINYKNLNFVNRYDPSVAAHLRSGASSGGSGDGARARRRVGGAA